MPTKYQVSVNKCSVSKACNDIETRSTMGSDYWAAYVGGAKIKTDSLKSHTRSNVRDVTAGATGAIMVASDFSDTLTLF